MEDFQQSESQIQVLLVEDNPGDVRLTREAFRDAKLRVQLHVAQDGVEALDFLFRKGRYGESPSIDLILLDINLPRMNGVEVLQEIKSRDDLKQIPVIVLTTSDSYADRERCYRLHANCFVNKPMDMEEFVDVVSGIKEFWFSIVKLPGKARL